MVQDESKIPSVPPIADPDDLKESGVTVQDYEGGPARKLTYGEVHEWIKEAFYGIVLNPKYQLDPSKEYEYPVYMKP